MQLFSFDPCKNKYILAGNFDKYTGIFTKIVKPNHYMRIERGYGISEDVIEQLIQLDCQLIHIITKNKTYEFTFAEVLLIIPHDYCSGKQRFLKTIKE